MFARWRRELDKRPCHQPSLFLFAIRTASKWCGGEFRPNNPIAVSSLTFNTLFESLFLLREVQFNSHFLLSTLLITVLKQLLGKCLTLGAYPPDFFFIFFFAKGKLTFFSALQHLSDRWLLEKILHLSLIVNVTAVISLFVIELYCILNMLPFTV